MADTASDVRIVIDHAPNSGDLGITLEFASHFPLTRAQFNTVRSAGLSTGYSGIRGALDGIKAGADDWLDRWTTGADSTETDLIRASVVWHFTSREAIPTPPSP
jgi:hypothetical protein